MDRALFDRLFEALRAEVESDDGIRVFPLDIAVARVIAQEEARRSVFLKGSEAPKEARRLLEIFDATSVSAAIAVKRMSQRGADTTGITAALVDLWGQAEAARCLWFDRYALFTGDEAAQRHEAIRETARVLAPEAVAIAIRLGESVGQYVEFVSKVAGSEMVRSSQNS